MLRLLLKSTKHPRTDGAMELLLEGRSVLVFIHGSRNAKFLKARNGIDAHMRDGRSTRL